MKIRVLLFSILLCLPFAAKAAYHHARPIDACSAMLTDHDAFVRQLNEKSGIEDYMANILLEVRRHPAFASIDPERILILKSADAKPPLIWVFPAHTTAALGLADGVSDRHGSIGGRAHKFESPLEYKLSDLQDPSPKGNLLFIPTISSAALYTSDGRTVRPKVGHVSFDYLDVSRWRFDSTQLILAFGKLIDRAEPALRNVYNRNYYYLLSELLLDNRLLDVLEPENVLRVTNHGYPYFIFPAVKANPFYGFVRHSEVFATLVADADRGNFVEVRSFANSGDTLRLAESGRQKLITFLANKARFPKQAVLELENVDGDTDIYDLQQKLFPASGFYQHLLKVLGDNGQTFPK